jgi:anti-sigma regulatory factor (Ser/Thr protein kinase)
VSSLRLDLDHAPQAAPTARSAVHVFLSEQWPESAGDPALVELLDDVAVVVSELVGNAVNHGKPPVRLDVDASFDGRRPEVRVTCHDSGPWDGTPSRPEGGRGFVLVRGLATDVLVDADASHTSVGAVLVR